MDIAIVVFAYNRKDMLESMLRTLDSCEEKERFDVFFFSDGPKNDADSVKVDDVRRLIKKYSISNTFRNVYSVFREKNMGLANSVISGISEVICNYNGIICLEDDLIVGNDFLSLMRVGLEQFKADTRIWSISGYALGLNSIQDKTANSFLSYRSYSWGWATWPDRWNSIDWTVSDYNSFSRSKPKRQDFAKGGQDLPYVMDLQMNGLIDSWAIRWCYAQWKQGKLTVFPKESRVEHKGWGGESTHSKKELPGQQSIKTEYVRINQFDAVYDEAVMEEIRLFYPFNIMKIKVKLLLAKILQIKKI